MSSQVQRTKPWNSACCFLLTLTLPFEIDFTEALTWTTETLSTTCCEGQDKLLVWNYSTTENEIIRQLHWYYNTTTPICFKSESYGFNVAPLYEGRVEQYGSSGIRLKKMSPNDTGEYTLYLKLAGEQNKNVQTIFLTVYEPPKKQCKPVITILSKDVISCSTDSCGTSQLLSEWRIGGIRDPVGNESYLKVNASWNGEHVFCCLYGPSIECYNGDQSEFCTSTAISSTDKARHYRHTETTAQVALVVVIVVVTTCAVMILVGCCYKQRKLKRRQKASLKEECSTELQAFASGSLSTDPELHEETLNQRPQTVNLERLFQFEDSMKETDAFYDLKMATYIDTDDNMMKWNIRSGSSKYTKSENRGNTIWTNRDKVGTKESSSSCM